MNAQELIDEVEKESMKKVNWKILSEKVKKDMEKKK